MMSRIRAFLDLIKFEHTIFALPFAYAGMVLAARGWPGWPTFFWISVAMAAARTVAMAFNRIADLAYDARNPRTAQRPLVTGQVSLSTAWGGTLVALALLVLAAWRLGPLPLRLLPLALLALFGYSFTKRFTWISHFILGMTDGLAPMGAWVAVRGSLFGAADLPAWLLWLAVTLWIGGFDIIYACQDVAFDRAEGLYAIPARFGVARALRIARAAHVAFFIPLLGLYLTTHLSISYIVGLIPIAVLLAYEHAIVSPDDLSRVNIAFFNVNSIISIVLLVNISLALLLA